MFAEAIGYAIVKAFTMIIGVFLLSLVLSAIVIFILTIKMKGKKKWILRILLPFLSYIYNFPLV